MKNTNAKSSRRAASQAHPSAQATPQPPAKLGTHWLGLSVCAVICAVAAYLLVQHFLGGKLPSTIVGSWRVEGGEMHGARLTFRRDGTFAALVKLDDGRETSVEATVELKDSKLYYQVPGILAGQRQQQIQTILSLSDTEMIVEENGAKSRLLRIE